jgi:hypothetical protein
MICKFDDLNRIGCNEFVLQLRKSKASTMVQAPLFFLVVGACSGELVCGGARRSTVTASYGGPRDAIKLPGDAQAHRGTFQMLEVVDYGRS